MADSVNQVRVTLAGDGFYPQVFRWAGRDLRVLFVEGLRTRGAERWFRVRTVEGVYELVHQTRTGVWLLRRSPSWFGRTMAQLARTPRYSLPASHRRAGCGSRGGAGGGAGSVGTASEKTKEMPSSQGGGHASRLALVR